MNTKPLTQRESDEFGEQVDSYLKENSLKYRHLAIKNRIHPWNYRMLSGKKRKRPAPEWVVDKAMAPNFIMKGIAMAATLE